MFRSYTNLNKNERFILWRHDVDLIRDEYITQLEPLGFEPQYVSNNVVHNIQSLVFKVPKNIDRNQLIQYLKTREIKTTLGTYCLSNTTYYKNKYNKVQPNANFLENQTITLPCSDDVNVNFISKIINYAYE